MARADRSGNPAKRAAAKKEAAARAPAQPPRPPSTPGLHPQAGGDGRDQAIALYHVVYEHETFEDAAEVLLQMVRSCAQKFPGKRRILALDIDGHRNENGGFDDDMYELQKEFLMGFLLPYLSEAKVPLVHVKNPRPQRDDVPMHLNIMAGGPQAERESLLAETARETGRPVLDTETFEFVFPDGSRRPYRPGDPDWQGENESEESGDGESS